MTLRLRRTATLLACLALLSCSKVTGRQSHTDDPAAACKRCNVVLVSMDTVRADHLGVYGYGKDTSPNIDRLARNSVIFEDAISQAAWTLPAHASMFTGLQPAELGLTAYPSLHSPRIIPATVPTLASAFQAAGYATAGFTGGGFVAAHFGFGRGFDVYTSSGRRFEHNIGQALAWIGQQGSRPFFLFLHGYDAHRPYYSEAQDKRAVGLEGTLEVERREFCRGDNPSRPRDLDTVISYYDAAIHHADRSLGLLFDALEKSGLSEKTIVLLTSDHGEEFFEHGNCDHALSLYRETLHVPYLVQVPGLPSRRVGGPVPASRSIAPTLLALTGVESPITGPSLLAAVERGQRYAQPVYSHAISKSGHRGSRGEAIAITTTDSKIVIYTEEGSQEAFDRVRDPAESSPLPQGHPTYRLAARLPSWAEEHRATDADSRQSAPLPRQLREELRSLGYLD